MWIRRTVLLVILLAAAACGGAIPAMVEGMRAVREGARQQAEPGALPISDVTHGRWSGLPTQVAFAPEASLDAAGLTAWAQAELGIGLERGAGMPGPDGSELVRFQQVHAGVPVRGATYSAHVEGGRVTEVTGLVFGDIALNAAPSVTPDEALRRVQAHWPLVGPIERSTLEILPVPDAEKTRFRLVHVVPVLDRRGGGIWAIHVDAHSGEIVDVEALSSRFAAPQQGGTGAGIDTNGRTVSFATEHTSEIPAPDSGIVIEDLREGYRLRDVGRNLHTMSLDGATDVRTDEFWHDDQGQIHYKSWEFLLPSHDLIEEDNFWESDPDAVDVHSGLTKVYDYFLNTHGRRGHDGQNGYTPAAVRYWTHYAQASYHTAGKFLFFGDGGEYGRSFTTPDIVAHEFTHMMLRSIVELVIRGESGSVDEAIADIFAVHATFADSRHRWRIGADIDPAGFRDLSNPKSRGMPDTYEGQNWGEYQSDFGRSLGLDEITRHKNSTVMSHWFYLLSEGEEDGENDHGEEYEIRPIGMAKAAGILYRALFRLNSMATFESVREATIAVTRRMYGRCSEELRQVTNAWNAVGVGDPFCDCFEGSFIYAVQTEEGVQRARHYIRGEHYAVEITAPDGSKHIVNAGPGDRYRHYQGMPDIPVGGAYTLFLKELFQGRTMLVQQPYKRMTRRQYLEYREQHRTGRTGKLGEYDTHEYRMDDTTIWTTEDVCLNLTDYGGVMMRRTATTADDMRQVFFGFPVRWERAGQRGMWIENLREHTVDDRVFAR